ncbi:hypothetical protein BV372_26855 [Nostoc sp. T09]|nr:hypothetical protein BV372_26855 [Nostoc sp. T09]
MADWVTREAYSHEVSSCGFWFGGGRQQLPQFVQFQNELAVNYCKLVTVGVDALIVQAAFWARLGAQ